MINYKKYKKYTIQNLSQKIFKENKFFAFVNINNNNSKDQILNKIFLNKMNFKIHFNLKNFFQNNKNINGNFLILFSKNFQFFDFNKQNFTNFILTKNYKMIFLCFFVFDKFFFLNDFFFNKYKKIILILNLFYNNIFLLKYIYHYLKNFIYDL